MADFNEYKGVWVFCEQRQGALMSTDFELVSEARKLADELGCEVTGLLLGDNVEGIAKELGGYGADKVLVCDSPLLKDYTTDAYAKVVCDMVNEYKPEVLLIGATNIGRDLGPRCAARLHTGLTADATHLDIDTAKYIDFLKESSTIDLSKQKFDMEDRNLKMTRPAFGGHLMATIICPRFRPQMSTVRPGVMKKAPFDQAKADACQIVKPAFSLTAEDVKTEVLSVEKAAEKLVDLIGADVIVSVGRGISKDVNKGIELAEQLAAALGGGVVGDLAGFVAASFLRGIDFIQIPTTLLSQIDSSVGGKVAVDLPEGKNLVGAFYQPRGVFIDPDLLDTLPVRYLHDGFAEVIKCGAFGSADFFAALESLPDDRAILAAAESIIHRCILIKVAVVEKDERDTGARMVLNFGHTIGHAVERYYHYEKYTHGEGVGIGMVRLTQNAERLGLAQKGTAEKIKTLLARFGLPTGVSMNPEDIVRGIALDKKKRGHEITLVIVPEIGQHLLKKVSFDELMPYVEDKP